MAEHHGFVQVSKDGREIKRARKFFILKFGTTLHIGIQMKKRISVYRIVRDSAYKKLRPKDESEFNEERSKSWSFDASREGHKSWASLEMIPSNEGLKEPDIWEIVPGAFAIEEQVYDELYSSVEETQPLVRYLYLDGRKLAVINSTLCLDCLIESKSKFGNDLTNVVEYFFDGKQLAISLFKIPQTKRTELYTLEGFEQSKDFKTLVEKFRFTGIKFEFLWEGDSFMNM